ncbi:hypothetical protein AX15_006459 [Amanita polypyramis BW_CC]|nr:hypothetical protein AX15_006459 [Amanita polypyramis BW_CC]
MSSTSNQASAAQQTLDILYEISQLLNTQLDKETLGTCVSMIESGVNPEALAVSTTIALDGSDQALNIGQAVVQELGREKARIRGGYRVA